MRLCGAASVCLRLFCTWYLLQYLGFVFLKFCISSRVLRRSGLVWSGPGRVDDCARRRKRDIDAMACCRFLSVFSAGDSCSSFSVWDRYVRYGTSGTVVVPDHTRRERIANPFPMEPWCHLTNKQEIVETPALPEGRTNPTATSSEGTTQSTPPFNIKTR